MPTRSIKVKLIVSRRDGGQPLRRALWSTHEAAHISPYLGDETNHPQNGLLLRSDIHSLFDLGLIAIDPTTMKVAIAEHLKKGSYAELSGIRIATPSDPTLAASGDALKQHHAWTGLS
jgi:hypothetical protein